MHHFATDVHISVTKWRMMEYGTGALWDLWPPYAILQFWVMSRMICNVKVMLSKHFQDILILLICGGHTNPGKPDRHLANDNFKYIHFLKCWYFDSN